MDYGDYYNISENDLGRGAKIPLYKLNSSQEVFETMAEEMFEIIRNNNELGKPTVLICPVGPTGQYPPFIKKVNDTHLSLKQCWFINMDEYLTFDGHWIESTHRLSFRGFMQREVYGRINAQLCVPENQRIFPSPEELGRIETLLSQLGGADAAFGGIGINGHLAFNEPQNIKADVFANLPVRVLPVSQETRTINAAGDMNGAMECVPKWCVTIGMREILGARRIRLAVFRTWHRGVVRRAAYGPVSAMFPVSLCQKHPDVKIWLNDTAAQQP